MKKTNTYLMSTKPLLALFFLILFNSCSRKYSDFTLGELLPLKDMNTDKSDTYVLSRGYELGKSDFGGDETSRSYIKNVSETDQRLIVLTQVGSSNKIDYFTTNKDVYIQIKDDAKDLKFKFTGSGTPMSMIGSSLYYKGPNNTSLTLTTIPPSDSQPTVYQTKFY